MPTCPTATQCPSEPPRRGRPPGPADPSSDGHRTAVPAAHRDPVRVPTVAPARPAAPSRQPHDAPPARGRSATTWSIREARSAPAYSHPQIPRHRGRRTHSRRYPRLRVRRSRPAGPPLQKWRRVGYSDQGSPRSDCPPRSVAGRSPTGRPNAGRWSHHHHARHLSAVHHRAERSGPGPNPTGLHRTDLCRTAARWTGRAGSHCRTHGHRRCSDGPSRPDDPCDRHPSGCCQTDCPQHGCPHDDCPRHGRPPDYQTAPRSRYLGIRRPSWTAEPPHRHRRCRSPADVPARRWAGCWCRRTDGRDPHAVSLASDGCRRSSDGDPGSRLAPRWACRHLGRTGCRLRDRGGCRPAWAWR